MPANPDDPIIAQGCVATALPDLASDLCTPELNYGPIREVYFTRNAFAAPPTATEFARRLALTTGTPANGATAAVPPSPNDPDAITGPFVAAVSTNTGTRATEEFNGKLYAKPGRREFPVTTKETSQKNVALADLTARGGLSTRMFGVDSSGYWHGGQTGMGSGPGNLVLDLVIPDGFDTAQSITGSFTTGLGFYRGKRIISPIPLLSA